MTKGLPRSLKHADPRRSAIRKQTYQVRNGVLTVAGASGVGFGSLVIGDFPEGNILFLGATAYFQFTGPTSADLDNAWEGDFGIGTTAAGDATITNADVDIVSSTQIAAATLEASPRTRGTGATQAIFDNTDGSLELNLNLLIDDAHIGADDIAMTVNGEVVVAYQVQGDD